MTDEKQPDCVLDNGREIFVNLKAVTVVEFRALFDNKQGDAAGDDVLARCAGLTMEELLALSTYDWKVVLQTVLRVYRAPLALI